MTKYLTSLALHTSVSSSYHCLYCDRIHPDNGQWCGYCNGEVGDLRVVQLRAASERTKPGGGWQHPILMGPQCRRYHQENNRGNWRYMPADAREEIDGRKRTTVQKTA